MRPDPHLVHVLAILDVLDAALVATTQSLCVDHPALIEELPLRDPTGEQEAASLLCSTADALAAALRDYRLALLSAYDA
jgi:hypothetical protein